VEYTIEELVERTGVAARTIREHVRLGLLPPPVADGRPKLYSREHVLRLWVIVEGRRQGMRLQDIKAQLETMGPRDMARYEPKASPAPDPAPAPAPEPATRLEPALEAAPAPRPHAGFRADAPLAASPAPARRALRRHPAATRHDPHGQRRRAARRAPRRRRDP
jgi:DNA-binding transcriptional MerR regulator